MHENGRNRQPYAVALDLAGRPVVVVGAGNIAERKVRGLLEAGALVTIVAPQIAAALRELAQHGAVTLVARAFDDADLEGAILAFAATDDDAVNAAVVAAARARGILVNDASDGAHGDFSNPLTHRAGPLSFTVSTAGLSPSFALRLRDELRAQFGERYVRAAETLGRARVLVAQTVALERRARVLNALAAREIDELATMNTKTLENEIEQLLGAGATGAALEPFVHAVCATRASALALRQTRTVIAKLAIAGIASTILTVTTRADRDQERPLDALGGDNVFVKELELALEERRADYAVHSCKDLPSTIAPGMRIAAIGPREDPRDVFCSERYPSLAALPAGALVGTSSPRRRALVQALRPDLEFALIRGNVDTRLRKLREGHYDAIVLAAAGLNRLGLAAAHVEALDPAHVVPAVAQGALAVEVRAGDDVLAERIHAAFADRATEVAVTAERAFLRTLRAGCHAPVGAYARLEGSQLSISGAIAALDGSTVVRASLLEDVCDGAEADALGVALADRLLADGGAALLADEGTPRPLAGKLFVLPRTQERPSRIAAALRDAGADVVEARDSEQAARARRPDALLFPSSGSVGAVGEYLARLRSEGQRPVVATMGSESSAAAAAAGFPPDVVAADASIAAFVHGVTRHMLSKEASS
jgi:hydroxymethylbilane synthase